MTTQTQIHQVPQYNLVPDVWRIIFSKLSPKDLLILARVCTLFNKTINSDSWMVHCHRTFTATLFPENTNWKEFAFLYLFRALNRNCYITKYANNSLGISFDFHRFGFSTSMSIDTQKINELYLLIIPQGKYNFMEMVKSFTTRNSKMKFFLGASSSSNYCVLAFLKEEAIQALTAFLNAAKLQMLFNNPLRDFIIKLEAKALPSSIGCSQAAEAVELRRVSCVTPPVP